MLRRILELTALLSCSVLAVASFAATPGSGAGPSRTMALLRGWEIQSSCEVKTTGDKVSQVGFATEGWHKSTIPNTVVGTLVDDKTYAEPMVGTNLKNLPGMNYSSATFFANQDMPDGSPFKCSWWWRNEFILPAAYLKKNIAMHFPGINYRANMWFNGQKIADAQDVAGAYRIFEFDLTKYAKPGAKNVIALEMTAPAKEDLGITWVDWNPTPADKDLGIWKEVTVTATGPVAIANPFVKSQLNDDFTAADLTISADLRNDSIAVVKGVLFAEVGGKSVKQPVEIAAGETKTVRFEPAQFSELKFVQPKLWWPYTIGTPYLYKANFRFETANEISDSATVSFGIRQVTSELTEKGHRLFKINGRRILIRGAAWAPDMFLRPMSKKLDADLRYVKDMGLNTIRLEGRIDRDELFNKTDELGILVMPGWTCCDAWELWDKWTPDTRKIAAASMADQARRLRNHPSVFVWLYGSDNPPPAEVEKMYLGILHDAEWPNPSVSSASAAPTTVTGNSGVKMTGPYEYVPPVYWLADTTAGGAYGYNTETSPGPAIPTLESVKRFIPKQHLWPIDDVWNYHAGGERFTTVNVFTDGLNKRYGTATSLEDYERKAQAVAYDGERAMFESYGRNKYVATGVDDQSVAVVNDTYQERKGMKVRAGVYSLDAKLLASKEETIDVPADAAVKAFDLPKPDGVSMTFFVKLDLRDAHGRNVSDNFYWLSAKADTLDWAHKQDTVYTPQAEFGDLTGLNSLPQIKLQTSALLDQKSGAATGKAHVRVKNTSSSVAFQIRLRLADKKYDHDVVPVFWEDNYFSLLPGEERIISVSYDTRELQGSRPVIQIGGFNIAAGEVPQQSGVEH